MTPEDAFAFEATIANDVAGIGLDLFDFSSQFNSAGRLSSLVQMDAVAKFPDDPATRFLGDNTTLSVIGQEVGHRWLASLRFSDHNRQPSDALLGRDSAHWSFFVDSDASVMEGNRIQDLGGGSFRTVAAVERYSLLDRYAMGLVRDIDVPKMFYVESPVNVSNNAAADAPPRVGVTFSGTRRDVLINDVIEVMGPGRPPLTHRRRCSGRRSCSSCRGPNRRSRRNRQGRSHPPGVGALLRTGDRKSRARRHATAVGIVIGSGRSEDLPLRT